MEEFKSVTRQSLKEYPIAFFGHKLLKRRPPLPPKKNPLDSYDIKSYKSEVQLEKPPGSGTLRLGVRCRKERTPTLCSIGKRCILFEARLEKQITEAGKAPRLFI